MQNENSGNFAGNIVDASIPDVLEYGPNEFWHPMTSVKRTSGKVLGFVFLLAVLPLSAQQASQSADQTAPPQSLAEIARQAQKSKSAHAKKLITEDELAAMKGPLPRITMEGADNAEEIVAAIGAYQAKHTKEETEQAVHDWYDNYDTMLATAIRDSLESKDRRDSTLFTGFQLCQQSDEYQKCELKRQAEMRGARHDQLVMRDDGMVTGRIQQNFMKVRSGITQYGLVYPWFKVRNGNGNGSF